MQKKNIQENSNLQSINHKNADIEATQSFNSN